MRWTLEAVDREIEAYRGHLRMALENRLLDLAEGYAKHLDTLQWERQRLRITKETAK